MTKTPDNETQGFTYGYYRRMIAAALEKGYKFVSFTEFDPERHKRAVLLRHDIDLSLKSALEMAKIEYEMGIRSTFFIRLNSTFYNPFSQHGHKLVMQIKDCGHDFGLHFDPGFYESNKIPLLDGLQREKSILKSGIDTPVIVFSQHRPVALNLRNIDALTSEFKFSVYAERFTKDCKYISDSGQNWREGDLIDMLSHHERIQVLIHPVWWRDAYTPWQQCLTELAEQEANLITDKADILLQRYAGYLEKVSKKKENS